MNTTIDTLHGGRKATVVFEDGRTEEVHVQQIKIGRYDELINPTRQNPVPIFMDEVALTAAICGKPRQWITGKAPEFADGITPACYELLRGLAWEVNQHGFFAYAARKQKENTEAFLRLPADERERLTRQFQSPPPSRG
jgi:hypothetical protein